MKRLIFISYSICLILCLYSFQKKEHTAKRGNTPVTVTIDTTIIFDASRHRDIPVAIYTRKESSGNKHPKVVLFNHGYGQNRGGDYLQYSYITEHLAAEGYYVVSIQHELPTDSLMPMNGIPQIVRRSNWERGVENIHFILGELKKKHPGFDYKHLIIMGHSNGGDMAMLFAQKYPALVDKVISLDNRRVALPRTKQPKVYSIRSSDQPADEGILPDEKDQHNYGITIVKSLITPHNDMDNNASDAQRKEIIVYIDRFLKGK